MDVYNSVFRVMLVQYSSQNSDFGQEKKTSGSIIQTS